MAAMRTPLSGTLNALLLLVAGMILVSTPARAEAPADVHEITFTAIEGGELPLAQYRGQALLIVNTASLCGFTRQYADLQALWERYRDRGLVVLGLPSNDFGGQEPGSAAEIKEFCEVNFGIDFPTTQRVRVRGREAHPLYHWVAEQGGDAALPRWNFHKLLVGPDGRLAGWFASAVEPLSAELTEAVEALLPSG